LPRDWRDPPADPIPSGAPEPDQFLPRTAPERRRLGHIADISFNQNGK